MFGRGPVLHTMRIHALKLTRYGLDSYRANGQHPDFIRLGKLVKTVAVVSLQFITIIDGCCAVAFEVVVDHILSMFFFSFRVPESAFLFAWRKLSAICIFAAAPTFICFTCINYRNYSSATVKFLKFWRYSRFTCYLILGLDQCSLWFPQHTYMPITKVCLEYGQRHQPFFKMR